MRPQGFELLKVVITHMKTQRPPVQVVPVQEDSKGLEWAGEVKTQIGPCL